MNLFLSCAPGLEDMLAAEIRELKLGTPEVVPGGIEMKGGLRSIYRANLEVGLAQQVRARVGEFRADNLGELQKKASKLELERWVSAEGPLRVTATCRKSTLKHSGAVIDRVERAVDKRVGVRVPRGRGGAHVHVRVVGSQATISVDTSGEPLHRRGYRRDPGPAPLREDLARALVIASGWDRRSPLVDPMAGSGTIAIEAALLASGRAPGAKRSFAFQSAPCFDQALWTRTREAAPKESDAPTIFASDRDAASVARTRANAERAGVTLEIAQASLSEAPGLSDAQAVVSNPPWGERLEGDPTAVHRALGALIRDHARGAAVGPPEIGTALGLPSQLMTDARGTKVCFFVRLA